MKGNRFLKCLNFEGDRKYDCYIILRGLAERCDERIPEDKLDENDSDDMQDDLAYKELGPGDSFGEECLNDEYPDKPHLSVIIQEDCHCAVLTRKHFTMFTNEVGREVFVNIHILGKNEFFNPANWSKLALLEIMKNFKYPPFRSKGDVIYNQGDAVDKVYFIKSGRVQSRLRGAQDIPLGQRTGPMQREVEVCVYESLQFFGEEEAYAIDKRNKEEFMKQSEFKQVHRR